MDATTTTPASADAEKNPQQCQPQQTSSRLTLSTLVSLLAFPFLVASSLCIATIGYWLITQTLLDSNTIETVIFKTLSNAQVGWMLGSLRILELAMGWYGNFDSYDVAALAILSHGPTLYLLYAFYDVLVSTTITSIFVEILSVFLPFHLLRSVSDPHSTHPSGNIVLANREVIADRFIQVLTTVLGAIIYSVVILVSFSTYLPICLVLYFKNIPSVEAAHVLCIAPLVPMALGFGLAARVYIFTPVAAAAAAAQGGVAIEADLKADDRFDPTGADLREETVGGWGAAVTKVGIKRTAFAALTSGVHTALQLMYGIKGVETTGAVAYAAVWVVAAIFTGVGLGAVLK